MHVTFPRHAISLSRSREQAQYLYAPLRATHRTEEHMAGKINATLKRAVYPKCQAGNANKTLYVKLWEQVQAKLLPHTAQHIWTSSAVTHSMLRNVLKAQFGQLWNMNMAYARKMPYMKGLRVATSNACPL